MTRRAAATLGAIVVIAVQDRRVRGDHELRAAGLDEVMGRYFRLYIQQVKSEGETGHRETVRVEAFSDGVFAIAMTLLALELRVPHGTPGSKLGEELLELWPSYAAFLTSFITIGIIWLNHHRLFALVARVDSRLLLCNTLLLLVVTALSFPTSLVAEYLGHEGERVAAVTYAAMFLLLSLSFNLMWWRIRAAKHPRLLGVPDDDPEVLDLHAAYRFGSVPYLACVGIALINATAAVAMILALAIYWAIKARPVRERAQR